MFKSNNLSTILINTNGEKFYPITQQIESDLKKLITSNSTHSGILTIFCPHTSCGLVMNESYDQSAKEDLENFLKHLAPRNLKFIKHTDEGEDDSPSHMKSILIQSSLNLIVEESKIILGTWQGIYLAEFRDTSKQRKVYLKFQADSN